MIIMRRRLIIITRCIVVMNRAIVIIRIQYCRPMTKDSNLSYGLLSLLMYIRWSDDGLSACQPAVSIGEPHFEIWALHMDSNLQYLHDFPREKTVS